MKRGIFLLAMTLKTFSLPLAATAQWGGKIVPPFVHAREGELALAELKQAAHSLGVTVRVLETRRMEDVEPTLRTVSAEQPDALYVSGVRCMSRLPKGLWSSRGNAGCRR